MRFNNLIRYVCCKVAQSKGVYLRNLLHKSMHPISFLILYVTYKTSALYFATTCVSNRYFEPNCVVRSSLKDRLVKYSCYLLLHSDIFLKRVGYKGVLYA